MTLHRISLLAALLPALALAANAPLIPSPVRAAEELFSAPLPAALDGRLSLVYRVGRSEGPREDGLHPLLGASVDAHGVRVSIRFRAAPSPARIAQLEEQGLSFARLPSGALANVGAIVEAFCPWTALRALGRAADVVRVSPTFGYRPLPPQAAPQISTRAEVEVLPLQRKLSPNARGEGVVVADMDSGFDPFHPAFFRADGGAYAWLDTNGNGAFDPAVDAVDFDRDGAAGAGEKLGMIKATLYWFYGTPNVYNASGPFVAGVDWLYQDENGDGARNQGTDAPYGDAKPTFGEQLYIADDVNGNGALDVGEKVIRLHTPKVKAAMSTNQNGQSRVYRRGVDLSRFPSEYPGQEMHGTMVMGTIAGADPRHMRYAGLAPDAELLLATTNTQSLVASLAWARSEGAQIVLWEMATWYLEHLDGGSNHELACDTASDEGVLQIGAAGNLGGSRKHRVKLHGTGTEQVPLQIPTGLAQYVIGNFNWRGAASALTFQVTIGGTTLNLPPSGGQTTVGNVTVYWGADASVRGTHMLYWYLLPPQGQMLAGQTATFTVTNSGAPTEVHGYVMDDASSWGLGVAWPATTGATDLGTYGTPAVGDKTLAIGTQFLDFVPAGEASGALAGHSGQGPRIDGADSIDLVAPEDHVTAISWAGRAPFGSLMVGGGTSNASPMVVGMAAILKGLRTTATPTELRDLLHTHTQVEAQMGTVPNDQWGHGKARVYRSHFTGMLPPTTGAPTAAGTAQRDGMTLRLDASPSSDPDGEALRYSWDVDYDGVVDTGPQDSATAAVALPAATVTHVRLEVVDPHGATGATLVEIVDAPIVPDAGTSSDGGTQNPDGGGGGGGGGYYFFPEMPDELGKNAGGCGCAGAGTFGPLALPLLLLVGWRARRTYSGR